MSYDKDLKDEVSELVTAWFAQARATDRELSRHSGYETSSNLACAIGALQFYVSDLAAKAGRDYHTVSFMLDSIRSDTERLGMAEVQSKMKGSSDDKDSS